MKVPEILKGIKGSPRTTIAGIVCVVASGFLLWKTGYEDLSYTSAEGGLFLLGLYLFVLDTGEDEA